MKIALATLCKNEEAVLEKTAPVMAQCFRYKLAFDTGSSDKTPTLLGSCGFKVLTYPWNWDFGKARNDLMTWAAEEGMDWIWFWDADESWWPADVSRAKDYLDLGEALGFPRYNLIYDVKHWEAFSYPDIQVRLIKLKAGWSYVNKLHEVIVHAEGLKPATLHDMHIFHYGSCKPIKKVWFKHHRYNMLKYGKMPMEEIPEDIGAMSHAQFTMIYCGAAPQAKDFTGPNPLGDGLLWPMT